MKQFIKVIILSIIIITSVLYLIEILNNKYKADYESNLVESYFEKQGNPKMISSDDYIGVLEIPKINLTRGFYNKDDKRNNIESNVTLIDYINNTVIFAAHSGNGEIAYFNNIKLLEKGDKINLHYKDKKYTYVVNNKYLDNKNGTVGITTTKVNRIILITCNNNDLNNYLVVEALR